MPSLLQTTLDGISPIAVASLCLSGDNEFASETQRTQTVHRLQILEAWLGASAENNHDIEANIVGKKTLDIGCGQGDMTALFASVLKAQGHKESRVIGVDPASLTYGSPFTLGQAQGHLSSGPLNQYLSFKQAFAPYLVSTSPFGTYSTAMFVHSLYYMPSSITLVETFKALRVAGVKSLLLAEWALSISRPDALAHLLAVLLQSVDPLPEGNIRTVMSPTAYIDAAREAGWEIVASKTITPDLELEDGKWEVHAARSIVNQRCADEIVFHDDERSLEAIRVETLKAHAAAMERSIPDGELGEVGEVASMDVWTAVFRPAI